MPWAGVVEEVAGPWAVVPQVLRGSFQFVGLFIRAVSLAIYALITHNLAHNAICPILVVVMRGNKVKRSTYKSRNSIEFRPWFLLKRGRQPEVVMRRRGRDGRGERVHDARGAVRREEPAAVEGRQAVGEERLCKEAVVVTQSICHSQLRN